MNKKIITGFLALIILAVIVVYWLRLGFDKVAVRDGLYLTTVLAPVIAGFYALSKYGIKKARGLTLLFLTGAVSFFLIGELIFEYHYLVLKHDIPFPSIADIFYLSSYPMLFAGLLNEIRLADVNFKKLNKKIWATLFITTAALTYVVYQWGIITGYDPQEKLLTNIISMAYGVGDLFLIILTMFLLILVREYRGGRFSSIWLFMLMGFAFLLTGDILQEFFRDAYHNEVWFWKSFLDTLGMAGYLCYAKALFDFGFSIVDAYKEVIGLAPKPGEVQKQITLKSNDLSEDK